jgi:hypothetical protein
MCSHPKITIINKYATAFAINTCSMFLIPIKRLTLMNIGLSTFNATLIKWALSCSILIYYKY